MSKPSLDKQMEELNQALFPDGAVRITFTGQVTVDLTELASNFGTDLDIGELDQVIIDNWYDNATITSVEVIE